MLELTVKEALEAGYTHCRYGTSHGENDVDLNSLNPDCVEKVDGHILYPYIYETKQLDLVIDKKYFIDRMSLFDEASSFFQLRKAPDSIWKPFLKQMQEWYDNNKLTKTKCVVKIINRRL